jgi:hypothetical protein
VCTLQRVDRDVELLSRFDGSGSGGCARRVTSARRCGYSSARRSARRVIRTRRSARNARSTHCVTRAHRSARRNTYTSACACTTHGTLTRGFPQPALANLLADVEHRRFVSLTFANNNAPSEVNRIKRLSHRFGGYQVSDVLVSSAVIFRSCYCSAFGNL